MYAASVMKQTMIKIAYGMEESGFRVLLELSGTFSKTMLEVPSIAAGIVEFALFMFSSFVYVRVGGETEYALDVVSIREDVENDHRRNDDDDQETSLYSIGGRWKTICSALSGCSSVP